MKINFKKPNIKMDKKQGKKLFLVLVIVLAVILVISLNNKFHLVGPNPNKQQMQEIKTGKSWGDKYIKIIQTEFKDSPNLDIMFLDIDNNETPEMLVKYKDEYDNDTMKIFYIEGKKTLSTNYFHNYSLNVVYDTRSKDAFLYLHIDNDGSGFYNRLDKIVTRESTSTEIDVSNKTLQIEFNNFYREELFKVEFYQINLKNLEADFKGAMEKLASNQKKYAKQLDTFKEKNKDEKPHYEKQEENKEFIIIKGHLLKYGKYRSIAVNRDTLKEEEHILELKYGGELVFDGDVYSYKVEHNTLVVNNEEEFEFFDENNGHNRFIFRKLDFRLIKDGANSDIE